MKNAIALVMFLFQFAAHSSPRCELTSLASAKSFQQQVIQGLEKTNPKLAEKISKIYLTHSSSPQRALAEVFLELKREELSYVRDNDRHEIIRTLTPSEAKVLQAQSPQYRLGTPEEATIHYVNQLRRPMIEVDKLLRQEVALELAPQTLSTHSADMLPTLLMVLSRPSNEVPYKIMRAEEVEVYVAKLRTWTPDSIQRLIEAYELYRADPKDAKIQSYLEGLDWSLANRVQTFWRDPTKEEYQKCCLARCHDCPVSLHLKK